MQICPICNETITGEIALFCPFCACEIKEPTPAIKKYTHKKYKTESPSFIKLMIYGLLIYVSYLLMKTYFDFNFYIIIIGLAFSLFIITMNDSIDLVR